MVRVDIECVLHAVIKRNEPSLAGAKWSIELF